MRLGRQHEIFGVSNANGLSNLLIDDIDNNYESYIQKTNIKNVYVLTRCIIPPKPSELLTNIKNVSILTRGIVTPNPCELLVSTKNSHLIKLLSKKFDYIIWDCVPVVGLTDSIIMAPLVDKIVIVATYKKTPIEVLKNANIALDKFKDKIAGVVLNKVPFKGNHYYSSYYSSYYSNN